jgi:hypothetical protein
MLGTVFEEYHCDLRILGVHDDLMYGEMTMFCIPANLTHERKNSLIMLLKLLYRLRVLSMEDIQRQ